MRWRDGLRRLVSLVHWFSFTVSSQTPSHSSVNSLSVHKRSLTMIRQRDAPIPAEPV